MPVKKLVILGDSITDCGRARPVGEGLPGALGNGYVNLFDAMAQVDHPAWKLRVVNMGTDGETSRDLLARWDTDCDALKPDIVAVLIGINDVWRQFDSHYRTEIHVLPDEYAANLREMVRRTVPARKLLFVSPFYFEPNEKDPMRAQMDVYRALMRTVAAENDIPFVDLQDAFAELLQHFYPGCITWDRVHPSAPAQLIIARQIMAAVESLLA